MDRFLILGSHILKPSTGECVEKFDEILIINCRGGLLLIDEYETMD